MLQEAQYPPAWAWKTELQKLSLQSVLKWNHSLNRLNTMRVGGNTECFIDVTCLEDLSQLLPFIQTHQIPWFIIGKGSNLLLPDDNWPGIALRLTGNFKRWTPLEEPFYVNAGAALADVTFAQKCAPLGWGGMEFLIGIPGCIGGAIAMNAGAHDGEICQFVKKVNWMDMAGDQHEIERDDIDFAYRYSPLNGKFDSIITSASFQLESSDTELVKQKMTQFRTFREEKQPRNIPNCGSVFKNPPDHHAAQLIESVGLKGHRIGDACISDLHSNFIVNLGHARTQDILDLIDIAKETVWKKHEIVLEPEVQILTVGS